MGSVFGQFPKVTLVTGGARAGKSRYAERLMQSRPGRHVMVATAIAGDDEMAARITRHRAERDPNWETIEQPISVRSAIRNAARPDRIVLVDCLTLWISNLMGENRDIDLEVAGLVGTLRTASGPVMLISNEVGLGIVPDNALARAYRDHLGRTNQAVAAMADCVLFLVAGIPLVVKGEAPR
ncbi:MAG: bifunctional adenosylcobinamide kinase/adenosylcobinamide-phosphate guanylyltransferase [Rhodospirillaceae bacterium]|nr:bifunctional adenosylcobinamide kinase/adenosylcobinamide-phosphate guanylyltransferase [Rhodospirillaceae bacterium]